MLILFFQANILADLRGKEKTFFEIIEERNLRKISHLRKAKYSIINGDLERADFYLRNLGGEKKFFVAKNRYRSMIYFIENYFQKSLDLISSQEFDHENVYPHICLLRVVNLLALGRDEDFIKEKKKCTSFVSDYAHQNHLWIDLLEKMKLKKTDEEFYIFYDIRSAVILIKYILFLGKENLAEKVIRDLPVKFYRSKRIRELLAVALYRLGREKEAFVFVEGIESPNADNIRGNVYLKQKKYLLALGHYKLAMEKKKNSLNALERSLSLLWMLQRWKEGIKIVDRLIDFEVDSRQKMALKAALLIRLEDFNSAKRWLNILQTGFKKEYPREIGLMKTYVALRGKK